MHFACIMRGCFVLFFFSFFAFAFQDTTAFRGIVMGSRFSYVRDHYRGWLGQRTTSWDRGGKTSCLDWCGGLGSVQFGQYLDGKRVDWALEEMLYRPCISPKREQKGACRSMS
ncbi:uncharacterized protein P884DRAFT_260243 [Thermothelomyces heterothallicus CBS 202.75]|uniref:uncharacterized protein n=1 Tax=Thermothelomyces heterothallicus CBS 202.75 TaxID=1149848 RepID=UPI0037428895